MILFCLYLYKLAGAVVPQTNSVVTKIAADIVDGYELIRKESR